MIFFPLTTSVHQDVLVGVAIPSQWPTFLFCVFVRRRRLFRPCLSPPWLTTTSHRQDQAFFSFLPFLLSSPFSLLSFLYPPFLFLELWCQYLRKERSRLLVKKSKDGCGRCALDTKQVAIQKSRKRNCPTPPPPFRFPVLTNAAARRTLGVTAEVFFLGFLLYPLYNSSRLPFRAFPGKRKEFLRGSCFFRENQFSPLVTPAAVFFLFYFCTSTKKTTPGMVQSRGTKDS